MRIKRILLILPFLLYAALTPSADDVSESRVKIYLEQAAELYSRGDYTGSIGMLDAALKIEPWDRETVELIGSAFTRYEALFDDLMEGYLLLERGETEDAGELFSGIVRGSPEEGPAAPARRGLEKARRIGSMKAEASALFAAGRLDEAKLAWNRVLELLPGDTHAPLSLSKIAYKENASDKIRRQAGIYFDSGVLLFREGKYEEAEEQFENAAALGFRADESREYVKKIRRAASYREKAEDRKSEVNVAQYLREGIKFFNSSRYREALASLNEAYRIDPDNSQVREYIVRVTIALKREEEREVSPSSPFHDLVSNLTRLGREAYAKGDFQAAVRYWEEVLLIFPFNEVARLNLTKALAFTDPVLAEEILDEVFSEAMTLLDAGRGREAAVRLRLIVEADPEFEKARRVLRDIEAADESEVVTEEDRGLAEEFYAKGLLFYREEKLDDALEMWRRSVELDPDFHDARVFISQAETKKRNLMKREGSGGADGELQITIKRHYIYGITYFMDGLYREAISEWEEVLELNPDHRMARANIVRAKSRIALQETGS